MKFVGTSYFQVRQNYLEISVISVGENGLGTDCNTQTIMHGQLHLQSFPLESLVGSSLSWSPLIYDDDSPCHSMVNLQSRRPRSLSD